MQTFHPDNILPEWSWVKRFGSSKLFELQRDQGTIPGPDVRLCILHNIECFFTNSTGIL